MQAIKDYLKTAWPRYWEYIQVIIISILLGLFVRGYILEVKPVPSDSMEPTIHPGDRILVNKFIFFFSEPKRGDIVVAKGPQQETFFKGKHLDIVKRVVALPGDTVEIKNRTLFINGKPQTEKYIKEPINYTFGPRKVPEDKLFLLGDNRNLSFDSHVWETIWLPKKNLTGKVIKVFSW